MNISFGLVKLSDLPNITRWMQDEEVARWWYEDNSEDAVRAEWEPRARGEDDKVDRYVISVDGCDIGLIQATHNSAYPDHAAEMQIRDSAGVDVLIGIPEWRDRGVGTTLIGQFVDEIVFANKLIQRCTIDPEPDNKRAIRVYEKVGFRHVRTYRSKISGMDVYLMVKERRVA
jgi:aminoglycoside 6'-N-acetyltransferase